MVTVPPEQAEVRTAPEPDGVRFADWYEAAHPRLLATLVLVTGDVDLAGEGVDEACARALERWSRVGAMASPTGWVYRVALNHVRRVARRRQLERRLLLRSRPREEVPAPAAEIWQVVAGLPPRQREVVVLRHVGDLPEAEIGRILGISRGTVSSTLADAHRQLGRLLDSTTEEGHDDE